METEIRDNFRPEPLYNPLPEPVSGRRDEMEFPITDVDDGEDPLSDRFDAEDSNACGKTEAVSDLSLNGGNASAAPDIRESPKDAEDDFDFPVDESDDFDI